MSKSKKEVQQDYSRRTGYRANSKYNKEKTKVYAIRAVLATEQDIIRQLESVENKSGYIKRLIREDIARQTPADDP
ncbi:MAG: hypothetical protein LBQ15_03915 [Clostridium sp.]|nr:hypothetical protein [Clostridium sp.]